MTHIARTFAILIVAASCAWLLCGMCVIRRYAPAVAAAETATEILWLKLDDNTSNSTLVDSSASGTNKTFLWSSYDVDTSGQSVSGKIGRAINFTQSDGYTGYQSYLGTGYNSAFGEGKDFCVAFWFYRTGWVEYASNPIVDNGFGSRGTRPAGFYILTGTNWAQPFVEYKTTAHTGSQYLSWSTYPDEGWTHYIFQRTGTTVEIYANGALEASNTGTNNSAAMSHSDAPAGMLLGGYCYQDTSPYNTGMWAHALLGALDDFRIFNGALTQSQIDWLYNSGSGRAEALP